MKSIKLFIVIASLLILNEAAFSQKNLPSATVTVCENTDDGVNPINPKTTVKAFEPVVYQIAFVNKYKIKDETEPEQFFIDWKVYLIDDAGNDVSVYGEKTMTVNSLYRRYALTEPVTFTAPGKYRIYALPVGWSETDLKANDKNYYGMTEIEVVE